MELPYIFVLIALFFALRLVTNETLRERGYLALSAAFPFIFQPTVPIRNFTFWFPFATIALTFVVWAIFAERPGTDETDREALRFPWFARNRVLIVEAATVAAVVALISLSRYAGFDGRILASRPPRIERLAIPLAVVVTAVALIRRTRESARNAQLSGAIALILILLIFQKTAPLAQLASQFLRFGAGQSTQEAFATDIRWFGFSYIAFRLLSVAIEARKGRKFAGTAGQFLIYVCFPPTLSAGPIDRFDRFQKELATPNRFNDNDLIFAAERIALGLIKKFILADALSFISLSAQNAPQFRAAGWAWLALYAYAFQIYLDFAGYSDIAIGIGRLAGLTIPENFNAPYLKRNIALFWNNWHMTLTGWIRNYCFNPLTRALRKRKAAPWLIILIGQLVTMGLIGLWHGVTVNFLIWGLWNALGLFIHQLYADHILKKVRPALSARPWLEKIYTAAATVLTFQFVALSWIFFALPRFDLALTFLRRLFS